METEIENLVQRFDNDMGEKQVTNFSVLVARRGGGEARGSE